MSRSLLVLALLLVGGVAAIHPQEATVQRGLALERRGNYQGAADVYRELLKENPANGSALLSLERVLQQLGRPDAMTGPATAALAAQPTNPGLYALALRAWSAAARPDSVRRIVERWAELEPGSEAPYREWGFAAQARRDRAGARAAYLAGRERLGRPDAMAGELAQLAALEGDYRTAVSEWVHAMRRVPGFRGAALSLLGQAPVEQRQAILLQLERADEDAATRLAAALAVRWGEPLRGIRSLARALGEGAEGIEALNEFLNELRTPTKPDGHRARAQALEMLAERQGPEGSRWLVDAARSYAEAGDQPAARRVLARLAGDPSAAPRVAASAGATLIGVLIDEGRVEEADRKLAELAGSIRAEDRLALTHDLVKAWLRAGNLKQAERLVAGDSSVGGLALLGRIRLYRGDLAGAMEALMAGGPFAGAREEGTTGAELLALLQVIEVDSLPALGAALFALERRDSLTAAEGLEGAARGLPAQRGGAELLLRAARIRRARGERVEAERLYRAASEGGGPAPSATAQYELGTLLAQLGRAGEALATLERLIIEHPESSVTPQARRLLDSVRGGIPPT